MIAKRPDLGQAKCSEQREGKISFLCEEVVANAKFMPNQNTPKVKPFVEEEEEEEKMNVQEKGTDHLNLL